MPQKDLTLQLRKDYEKLQEHVIAVDPVDSKFVVFSLSIMSVGFTPLHHKAAEGDTSGRYVGFISFYKPQDSRSWLWFGCILAGSSATNKSGYCESASAGLSLVRGEYACLALYSGITQHLMQQGLAS